MTRPDRGGFGEFDEFGEPISRTGSTNPKSPWHTSEGPGDSLRTRSTQGAVRTTAATHFEESEHKMEMTNKFANVDDDLPQPPRRQIGEGQR